MAHLRKRGNVWYAVIYLGNNKYDWKPLSRDEAEAKKMVQLLEQQPKTIQSNSYTLGEWLDEWLTVYASTSVRPTTYASYDMLVNVHFKKAIVDGAPLGKVKLSELKPIHIQKYLAEKRRSGLSNTTIRYHFRILRRALSFAEANGYVSPNPAEGAVPPPPEEPDLEVWSADQAAEFLYKIRDHWAYALFATAILTGMRRGEIVGLEWPNVDFQRRRLWIKQTVVYDGNKPIVQQMPKTKKGRRSVAVGSGLLQILKDHKEEQIRKGSYLPNGWVWPNRYGNHIDPHNLSGKTFPLLIKKTGLPRIRFHDLRHTHFTDLAVSGVHVKVMADRAGHSSVSFTQDKYTKVLPDTQGSVADLSEQNILGRLESFATHLQEGVQTDDDDATETPL